MGRILKELKAEAETALRDLEESAADVRVEGLPKPEEVCALGLRAHAKREGSKDNRDHKDNRVEQYRGQGEALREELAQEEELRNEVSPSPLRSTARSCPMWATKYSSSSGLSRHSASPGSSPPTSSGIASAPSGPPSRLSFTRRAGPGSRMRRTLRVSSRKPASNLKISFCKAMAGE